MATTDKPNATSDSLGLEHATIASLIPAGSSVLDLGCGDGTLLSFLVNEKGCRGQGIEIDEQEIYACVGKGLSVIHGDIDSGLSGYADKSFDFVILDQVFQQVRKPDPVLRDALRVGRKAIVGFPNFTYYRARWQIFFKGRTPITPSLPYQWHDTPNVHFLSISDFVEYCRQKGIKIERSAFFAGRKRVRLFPNLFALTGVFLLSNGSA